MLELRRGLSPSPSAYVSEQERRAFACLVWNHSSSWTWVSPSVLYSLFSFQHMEVCVNGLVDTKCMMLWSIIIFIACALLCFVWLEQTSVKDVITLNLALILHPACLPWGSIPSCNQHYLISIVSVVWDSACLFNTSLKLMLVFQAALLPLPKH